MALLGDLGTPPSLGLVAGRTGILIPLYRIVVGIKRKSANVAPGTGEVLNKLAPFYPSVPRIWVS